MRVLVACEESQAVTKAFRLVGHEAYSCDIEPCSGGHPEWHIHNDCLDLLDGHCEFYTFDGRYHRIDGTWDIIIAHPPCTYLTNAGNKWFKPEYKDRFPDREAKRDDAVKFFMDIWYSNCDRVAIENPQGVMSSRFRPPDQYIEPYMFGDAAKKKTGLWLRGLATLRPTNVVKPVIVECKSGAKEPKWHIDTMRLPPAQRSKARSKTYPGIAHAMADQWGNLA